MIVDEILALAKRLQIDTDPPAGTTFGYECSYAGWLMGEIERTLGTEHNNLTLGLRFESACEIARMSYV
jgi:hypothetical protein